MMKRILFFTLFFAFSFTVQSSEENIESRLNASEEVKEPRSSGIFGASALMNPNLSLLLNAFAYTSNLKSSDLTGRFFPAHVEELGLKKGFNLESAELFFFAPVDPYFNLYASIPITMEGIELEEVYFVTTSLPAGFQIKGGKFRSNFGRINSQHPHQWDFADSPLPYPEFLGGDGVREKGLQLTYLPALPFYTLLGIEVLQGENDVLFAPDAGSGPSAFSAFLKTSFDVGEHSATLFGPSVISGRTKTDSIGENTEFSGHSTLYGFELTHKWQPSKKQSFILQSEYLYRRQKGDLKDIIKGTVAPLERSQDGLYLQGIYKWNRWRFGLRGDVLNIFQEEYIFADVRQDPGKRPWRASGSIEFNPSEFSRIRLQYNHDKSRDERTNHEWILQFTMGIGAHGAHPF